MNSILFDIGGTKMRISYSENGENFDEPKVLKTPSNCEEGVRVFMETAKEIANGREIKNIAGGMSRNIPGYAYENFKKDLGEEFTNAEVFLENDSAIVGLGEAVYGAGRGFDIMAYITVSTGVGGARIVNQKIDERAVGFEPGKQIMDVENEKTLEDLISGRALHERKGKNPKDILDPKIWEEEAKMLAYGLHNIIVEWSPNCIVLGGSMVTGDPSIPLDKTEEYLKEILKIFPKLPMIKKAELGDFGGIWGAMAYIKQK